MNIVFFVDSYLRKASACGICIKKVADELSTQGHQVFVFTSFTAPGQPKFEVDNGVHIYRMRRNSVSAFKVFIEDKKRGSTLWQKLLVHYVRARFCILLWFWPITSFSTPFRYCQYARKVLGETKADVIIGTFYHIEELLASIKLKEKYPEAIQISYLLDALTNADTPTILKRKDIAKHSIERWIAKILNRSQFVCPMTSHIPFYESNEYPESIKRKMHYMGIPVLDLQNRESKAENRKIKKIVYTGYSNRQAGSAKYLVELMPYLNNVHLHLYGSIDAEITTAIHNTGLLDTRIFFHGFVEYTVATEAQIDADFLANFSGTNPYMVSSKLFDYMSKRKPIISFYQDDNAADLYFVKKYPNAIAIKDTGANHYDDAEKLNEFLLRSDFAEIDNECLRELFYENTPEAMVELIHRLLRGTNG